MALGPFYVAEKLKQAGGIKGVALLMRHGETPWNREGRVMGKSPVDLDEDGRVQVESAVPLARLLAPQLIISSPLARARQSAEIIGKGIGIADVIDDPRLREVEYGRWEGMVYNDLIKDPHYIHYREHPLDEPTPGGETIYHVQARGVEAVRHTIAANPGKRVLFVSHGDIIRTVLCHFMNLALENFRRIRIDNATFFGIQIAGDFAEIKFLNLLSDPTRVFQSPFKTKSGEAP
ncbi:MAG: histidine phosphatase family protein [Candidatus Binataceae bacterium]